MSNLLSETELFKSDIKYWYLHNHQIFSKLRNDELKALDVHIGFIKAKKNQIIKLPQGEEQRIYFLKQGLLKICRTEKGIQRTKELILKGDIFGEIPGYSISDMHEDCARVVSSEAIICTFTLSNFEKMLSKNSCLAMEFSKKLGDKLIKIERKYSSLVFKDAKSRFKELLKELANGYGKIENDLATIYINLTHQELADLIGCQRQTINTLMNELKSERKLEYNRESLRIPNISAL